MTDERFEELANSYLDDELNTEEFEILKEELNSSFERRSVFVFYRRLHNASCAALRGCGKGQSRETRIRRGQSGMKIFYLAQFGMAAACFALAFVVLATFFPKGSSSPSVVELEQTPPPLDLPLVNINSQPNNAIAQAPPASRQPRTLAQAQLAHFPDFQSLALQPVEGGNNTGSVPATVYILNGLDQPVILIGGIDFGETSPAIVEMQLMLSDRAFSIFEEESLSASARVVPRSNPQLQENPYRAELANFYFQR